MVEYLSASQLVAMENYLVSILNPVKDQDVLRGMPEYRLLVTVKNELDLRFTIGSMYNNAIVKYFCN